MVQAATIDSHELALALHALLRDLDPVRWRDEAADAARARMQEIHQDLTGLLMRIEAEGAMATLRAALVELVRLMEESLPAEDLARPDLRTAWMDFRAQLLPVYEQLAGALRVADVHVPTLRPTNYFRNVVHVGGGLLALFVIQGLGSASWILGVSGAFFVYGWCIEAARRIWPSINERVMAFYGPVAHPHEWHRVNSATWYCTAMLGLALTGSLPLCSVAVVVLGFSDPAAALVGRRYGKVPLVHGRTLEGTATFLVVALVVATATLRIFYPELAQGGGFVLAFGAALAATLAELFSRRVDDNLTIPLAAGGGMALAGTLFGVAF
jgi:dolichol kinase